MPRFVKVTKSNKDRDRGFIAVDAICSVFENRAAKTVSIMTMDGFWYDVEDDIEKLYGLVSGEGGMADKTKPHYVGGGMAAAEFATGGVVGYKKQYLRKKKMLAPVPGSSTVQRSHDDETKKPTSRKENFTKGLPTGVGKGQHTEESTDVFTPPSQETV